MKKNIWTLVSLIMVLVFAASMMTACGSEEDAVAEEEVVEEGAVEEAEAEEGAEGAAPAEGEAVSDETWTSLQESYAQMVDYQKQVIELYTDDDIAANADINEALVACDEVITEMGEITRENVAEEDAAALMDQMTAVAEVLVAAVEEMEAA